MAITYQVITPAQINEIRQERLREIELRAARADLDHEFLTEEVALELDVDKKAALETLLAEKAEQRADNERRHAAILAANSKRP